VAHKITPYDSITFSKDFIDDIENLLTVFNDISKNKLFTDSLSKPKLNQKDAPKYGSMWNSNLNEEESQLDVLGENYPEWFLKLSIASIAQWIVSHFEVRIYKL
jgi:hypothetical protein